MTPRRLDGSPNSEGETTAWFPPPGSPIRRKPSVLSGEISHLPRHAPSSRGIVALAQEMWKREVRSAARPRRRAKAALTVRDLPSAERPRERMAAAGAEALSAAELIACVLGRGISGESVLTTAQKLLARFGSLQGIAGASLEELSQVRGVGAAKAVQLKAACEMGRRVALDPAEPRSRVVASAEDAMRLARRHLAGKKKEHFILLLLDSRHRLVRAAEISVGTLDMSVVHPRETFREAITAGAAAILLAHNHPSGDPEPSDHDVALTRRLTEAGALLGIEVLDHLILASRGVVSLRAAGLLDGAARSARRRGQGALRRAP